MNRRRAYALIAAALADIAVFAAVAQDDNCFALQWRFIGELDTAQRGIVECGFAAVGEGVYCRIEPLAVGRVIDNQPDAGAESHDGDRIIRTKRFDITPGGRLRLRQRLIRHTAAGIHDQYTGEFQIVIGDVYYVGDLREASQVSADGEVFHAQARDQLLAGI